PGSLLQSATSAGHDTTFLFCLTDDAGEEDNEQNDHLFMLKLAPDGAVTRTSLATHVLSDVQASRQADGAVLVQNHLKPAEVIRYLPGGAKDNTFVTDARMVETNPSVVSLSNGDDGQVLALYSGFVAKLQSSDAPAGVFSG